MLPKVVLSFVGRLVGIAAVLVSPLVAQAAETSDAPSSKPTIARPSPSHGHRHKSADKKAKKRGTRHLEAAQAAQPKESDSEVTTERASAKNPPKQSSTPLPTLAAATTKPLDEPVTCKADRAHKQDKQDKADKADKASKVAKAEVTIEPMEHAAEPRKTPVIRVVRASLHTDEAAETPSRHGARADAKARHEKRAKPPCLHAPVSVTRGSEEETFPLTKCDGSALPEAVDEMSILVRPGSAAKPASSIAEASAKTVKTAKGAIKDDELAPGIKKIDERLVERLQLVIDHFAKPAATSKLFVVSGYRPTSKGSFHATGRAIDFRVDGIENTDLVAFCKTLPDTGCGFYPNSSFIHLDVRDSGSGHVSWIDASHPGDKPEYVAAWPVPPSDDDAVKQLARIDELQILPPPDREPREPKAEEAKKDGDGQSDDAVQVEAASVTRKLEDE